MNKCLIYGPGWIYKNLFQYIPKEITVIVATSRADDELAVKREILDVKPDRVLSLIGRIRGPPGDIQNIDYLEGNNPEESREKLLLNIRDNLFGPLCIAMVCNKLNIHYTYIGTGCIFKYEEGEEEKTEEDDPNFFGSSYSIVKGYTDRLMKMVDGEGAFGATTLNVRIRMPLTDDVYDKSSFLGKIINYQQIVSIPNSVAVLSDLLPILVDMIINKKTGTINLVNPGVITHKEIKELYIKYIDSDHKYTIMDTTQHDSKLKAQRSNIKLNTSKLLSMYHGIKTAYESIENIFKKCQLINKHI